MGLVGVFDASHVHAVVAHTLKHVSDALRLPSVRVCLLAVACELVGEIPALDMITHETRRIKNSKKKTPAARSGRFGSMHGRDLSPHFYWFILSVPHHENPGSL